MPELAINGGVPVRDHPFPAPYKNIGNEEKEAVMKVLDKKVLSQFLGEWSPDFYGGENVQALEKEWSEYFRIKHAVSVNSATSGLYAAVGAAGISPGDEVIVSPYTMTASATAALVYGGIPVFADIDQDIFCITPESIRKCITPYTKAIIVVDIFGHPADMDEIMEIAREHDLIVIEDAAQAPGATYNSRYAGTLGDIGVYSLNVHKTIQCGEGGVVVTNDEKFAERLQLIRNHAEVVVKEKGVKNLVNMIGFNYRMTEIEAAISREQLKKLEKLHKPRIEAAAYLTKNFSTIDGITTPVTKSNVRHGFYVYAIRYNHRLHKVNRNKIVAALIAEGIPIEGGYAEPIYLEPLYQNKIAFGNDGYPFTYPGYKGKAEYNRGLCPICECMHYDELMYSNICNAGTTRQDLDDMITAFHKIFDNIGELKG